MRTYYLSFALLLLFCSPAKAWQQKQVVPPGQKKGTVTVQPRADVQFSRIPRFTQAGQAIQEYLSQNIRYPALAREDGIQGKVIVRFLLGTDGLISHLSIVQDAGGGCGQEVMRVLEPCLAKGRKIPVVIALQTVFRLED